MKTTRLFCLLTLIFTGLTFSSCSDDDNKNDNGNGNDGSGSVSDSISTTFGPKNVFTGDLLKTINGLTIKYNSDGLVEEISNSKQKTTFEYQSKTKSTGDITTVIMKYNDSEDPTESSIVKFTIGSNGFASSALKIKSDSSILKNLELKYNSDGQLNYVKCINIEDKENEVYTITYDKGNLTGIKIVNNDNRTEKVDTSYQTIEYTSEIHSNGIENKGCIMKFDYVFRTDLDDIDIAYYAGLLGRATKKLPLKNIERKSDGDENTNEFNWTLNEKGYPTKLIGYIENDDNISIVYGW